MTLLFLLRMKKRYGKALDEPALARGCPRAITVDSGTEFTSKALGRGGAV